MPDVIIKYGSSTIAELSDSGTKICKTKDTIVQDDIEVEYTKSGGASEVTIPIYTQARGAESPTLLGNFTAYPGSDMSITGTPISTANFTLTNCQLMNENPRNNYAWYGHYVSGIGTKPAQILMPCPDLTHITDGTTYIGVLINYEIPDA